MDNPFESLIAVSGMPSLHKLVANRPNGLILEDVATGRRGFASARKHEFTPLASIGVYTNDGDTVELGKVFKTMQEKKEKVPVPENQAGADDLRAYFDEVLPNYDRDQVSISDMRKLVKWYRVVEENDLIPSEEGNEEEE